MSTLSDNGGSSCHAGLDGNASCKVRGNLRVVSFRDSGLKVIIGYLLIVGLDGFVDVVNKVVTSE